MHLFSCDISKHFSVKLVRLLSLPFFKENPFYMCSIKAISVKIASNSSHNEKFTFSLWLLNLAIFTEKCF